MKVHTYQTKNFRCEWSLIRTCIACASVCLESWTVVAFFKRRKGFGALTLLVCSLYVSLGLKFVWLRPSKHLRHMFSWSPDTNQIYGAKVLLATSRRSWLLFGRRIEFVRSDCSANMKEPPLGAELWPTWLAVKPQMFLLCKSFSLVVSMGRL